MLHHKLVGRVHSKECYFMYIYTFLTFFLFFMLKFVFLSISFFSFFFFFVEEFNFRNIIYTNQKPEWVIRNCQWNCIYNKFKSIKVQKDSSSPKAFQNFVNICLNYLMLRREKHKSCIKTAKLTRFAVSLDPLTPDVH